MPTEHQITEDDILSMATEKSFERGVDYYDSGLVESVTKRGNRLFAEVQGKRVGTLQRWSHLARG